MSKIHARWQTRAVLLVSILVASCVSGIGGTSASAAPATGTPLKFGLLADQSGPEATPEYGLAIEAYVANWNKHGGYKGHPIQLIVKDTMFNPTLTADFARTLVDQDQVIGMAGDGAYLDCSVNNSFYQSAGVAVLGGGLGTCFLAGTDFAEMRPNGSGGLSVAFDYLAHTGSKKIALVAPSLVAPTAITSVEAYMKTQRESSLVAAPPLPYPATAADFDSIISNLKSQNVDAVVALAGDTDASALFLQEAARANFGPANGIRVFVSSTSYTPSAASALDGAYLVTNGYPWSSLNNPQVKTAFQILKGKGSNANLDGFAELGYQDAGLFQEALDSIHGPVTRASYKEALKKLRNVPFALTPMKVTPSQPNTFPVGGGIVKAKNGKFVTVAQFVQTNY